MLGLRILMVGAMAFLLTGCATMQNKSSAVDQMQIKVSDLEKKVEEKDSEIVDLKYQVKDLASRLESQESAPSANSSRGSSDEIDQSSSSKGVIKVSASISDVQTALKNAGFYKGSVDGKIGQQTKKAIESFQRKHNLTADGVIGRRTWEELKVYLQ